MNEPLLQTTLLQEFQWFHRHPELSFAEEATTARLRQSLQQAGIRILSLPLKTGLVAELGTGKTPMIALRADIDALPVEETTDLPYRSEASGKMHACGHDFHMTSVLGAALLLKEQEPALPGTVRIVFQPGEEAPGGALDILKSGALGNAAAIFGLHSSPELPVGTAAFRDGAVTAAVDQFRITFTGKGSHAAHPENGIDPIVTAASFITAVQSIVSRSSSPFAANLVSITHIKSGNTWNVLPETAFLEGTARTLQARERELVRTRLHGLAEYTAKAYGAKASVDWIAGPPATHNTPEWTDLARQTAEESGLLTRTAPVSLIGEDFAYYQEKLPGTFLMIGTGKSAPLHNPHFQADPQALLPTARYLARLAEKALEKLS